MRLLLRVMESFGGKVNLIVLGAALHGTEASQKLMETLQLSLILIILVPL